MLIKDFLAKEDLASFKEERIVEFTSDKRLNFTTEIKVYEDNYQYKVYRDDVLTAERRFIDSEWQTWKYQNGSKFIYRTRNLSNGHSESYLWREYKEGEIIREYND